MTCAFRDDWIERPGLAGLAEYEIVSTRDGKSRPVLDKIGKEGVVVSKDGQQVQLSPAGAAILRFNKSTLDYTVTRFKSLLPKRTRGEDRFPSDELREKKKAKNARKQEGVGRQRRRGGNVELKAELDELKAKQEAERQSKSRNKERISALVGAISSREELEKAWRAVTDADSAERPPDSLDELRAAVLASCEPNDEGVLTGVVVGVGGVQPESDMPKGTVLVFP